MSNDITIGIDVDDTILLAKMADVDRIVDESTRKAAEARKEILQGIQGVMMGMNYAIQSIRMVIRASGQTLDPVQNAFLSMISSTTSLMISTALALSTASLGLLTGVALGLSAFAYGFQAAESTKLIAEFAAQRERFEYLEANLDKFRNFGINIGGTF